MKLEEVQSVLKTQINLKNKKIDLTEIQGTSEEIAIHKTEEAFKNLNSPILIEDTSLYFKCLNNLPGPYIKHFLENLGSEKMAKIVNSFENQEAYAQTIFGYKEKKEDFPILFKGVTYGKIIFPKVDSFKRWDYIFKPEGFDVCYAEMSMDLKNKISHRGKALVKLIKFFKK